MFCFEFEFGTLYYIGTYYKNAILSIEFQNGLVHRNYNETEKLTKLIRFYNYKLPISYNKVTYYNQFVNKIQQFYCKTKSAQIQKAIIEILI